MSTRGGTEVLSRRLIWFTSSAVFVAVALYFAYLAYVEAEEGPFRTVSKVKLVRLKGELLEEALETKGRAGGVWPLGIDVGLAYYVSESDIWFIDFARSAEGIHTMRAVDSRDVLPISKADLAKRMAGRPEVLIQSPDRSLRIVMPTRSPTEGSAVFELHDGYQRARVTLNLNELVDK